MKLHPLDFEEFLDAAGASMMKEHIRQRFDERKPLGPGVHEKALDLYRQYMVVGGMPQSVAAYLCDGENSITAWCTVRQLGDKRGNVLRECCGTDACRLRAGPVFLFEV